MNAESSATTIRRGVCCFTAGVSGAELDAREDALGVEQDDETVCDLRDRVDEVGAGSGDSVELGGFDREHFLDLVDDDAGGARLGLDAHDLYGVGELGRPADASAEVADADELAP